jgi:hypothetical protein
MRRTSIGVAIAATGFKNVTDCYWFSQFVGVVFEERQLVIDDFVAGCMRFGYSDRSPALYAPVGDSRERCSSHDFDKEHVKYIVYRIPNHVKPVSPPLPGRCRSWTLQR